MTTQTWPQPFEGIRGTEYRSYLLSLDEKAIAHREALIDMAHHLSTATLVGSPAPVVRRIGERLRLPEPGDLVVTTEVMHGRKDPDDRLKGFGVYLTGRTEWCETDAEWAAYKGNKSWEVPDEDRMTDDVFYIQYGPSPGDICRWHNSAAVVLPIEVGTFAADAAASREETESGGVRATFTRNSLIGGLADSGFVLRGLSGELPGDLEVDQLVTVRVPSGQITRVEAAAFPAGTTR